jgi:hypothetical protein
MDISLTQMMELVAEKLGIFQSLNFSVSLLEQKIKIPIHFN